ncbi:MAG TPA: hypothetical protein VN764_19905 [Polyangiaceae bacterium]|nr:hypothetical protein [Polyangiaceae bacterium]
MNFDLFKTKDRRLVTLRLLQESPGYTLNESVIETALEGIGHLVSRDTVRGDLAWLAEQGLIGIDNVADRIMIATLTKRGEDVALGHAIHPGVKRPSPR